MQWLVIAVKPSLYGDVVRSNKLTLSPIIVTISHLYSNQIAITGAKIMIFKQ